MELNYGFDGSSSFEELEPAAPVPYDFTSPTGIVSADKWRNASVEERVKAAPRAFVKMTEALEQDKTRTVKGMNAAGEEVDKPLFDASGNYTTEGRDYLDRSRSFLEMAARHKTGGTEFDPIEGKLVEAEGLSGVLTQKREKQPDMFPGYDEAKEEAQAVMVEGKAKDFTFDDYVNHRNADLPENSPARLDKDNERMRKMFDQQKELSEFDPSKMDQDAFIWTAGGRKLPNIKKAVSDLAGAHAAIDAEDVSAADKKMMKINLRDAINKMDSGAITEAADAEANEFTWYKGGVLAPVLNAAGGEVKDLVGMEGQDLHSKFQRHMEKPDGDMYSFIEENQEMFSKDKYGMLDKLTNAYWAANRSTGAGAMLLAAAPFGGNDTITQYAADSSAVSDSAFEGMGGTEHYKALGMNFTNKGIYDMAGQVASVFSQFGAGVVVKGGLKGLSMAGLAGLGSRVAAKSVGAVAGGAAGGYLGSELGEAIGGETGEMVGGIAGGVIGGGLGLKGVGALQGTGAATAMGRQITLSEKAMKQAMTELAPNTLKNFGIKAIKDPSAYIGALQAGGMSFGSTYNQVFDKTGDAEEAYHQAGMKGLADGASAFIATAIFNRIAPGLEKGMSGVEGGWSGSIFKHLKMNKALKSVVSQDAQKAAIETLEGLAAEGSELRKALAPALRETINRAARANGLKGYGPLVGMGAEFMEETFDTALSDVFLAVLDDSKTWKGEVWDNIGAKFSEYMAAGVMGAFGGGLGESGGMVVEAAGAFRKKNRDTRVREIKEFAEVIWKDIKENNSDASAEMLGIKAASGAPVVSVANYMADESIPVEKRAKVLAQHAVSGFARRLEPSATTPVERAQKAQEKAKNAPPDPKVVRAQEMSDHLGQAPKDKDGNDMEWNAELREPSRDLTHNFTVGGDSFTMKSVAVKGETAVGAVLTDSKGVAKNLSPSEAAEQLKAADKIPFLKARKEGADSATRQSMIKSFGNFDSSQTTNYAQPIQSRTDSGTGPKVTPASQKGVGNPAGTQGGGDSQASGPSAPLATSGAKPVAPVKGLVKRTPTGNPDFDSAFKPERISFDEENHIYEADGEVKPSVTTLMKKHPHFHRKSTAAGALAAEEGTAFHAEVEKEFKGEATGLGAKVKEIIKGLKARASGPVVTEGAFATKKYAGMVDGLIPKADGKWILVDTKTASTEASYQHYNNGYTEKTAPFQKRASKAMSHKVQMKAYAEALKASGIEVDEVIIIHVPLDNPENAFEESIEMSSDPMDQANQYYEGIFGPAEKLDDFSPAKEEAEAAAEPVETTPPLATTPAAEPAPVVSEETPVAVREVFGRKPHQKDADVDAELQELWDDGVAVVVGEDEAEAREEHGIPASQRVLMIPASSIGNPSDVWDAVTEFNKKPTALNAQPDTANDKPSEGDPLFLDPSTPKFYANPVFGVEDEFGGVWSKDDKSQIYYKPAKGKTLPIGVNAVVEIEGDPDHVLVLTEEADGVYYFRQIDVKVIGEAMRGKDSVALGKLNTAWNRNRLTKAGEAIEPLLKELLAGKGTVDPAAFRKMLEDVLKVVAPGTNPAAINWDAKMEKGFFFNVKRDGDRLSMDLDKDAFVANLRSVFRSYDPSRGKLYDSFVANEVARQIAAFVDEEQTHFVAMREFSDAEIVGAFDSFAKLASQLDKEGNVKQAFVNDVFQRVAAQRVKGKKIEDFDDTDKYLVASETLRALNQILTSGVSTEQQTTDSKRLLIALNEDFSNKETSNPWKTVVELLKRYMQKIKRMAHLRYMMGQLPTSLNRMIRQQETAYVAANLRGDVDQIKEKGLEEAVERFQRSRDMTKKAIGAVAMKNNEVMVEIREIAGKLGMSLDDMIVLDYKAGTIRLRTFEDKDGVDVRGMIGRYYPGTDLEDLDKALGELNEEGALSLVQRDLVYAWQQLEWARANSPNFLSVLEDGSEPDKLKVWSQLVASAPLMNNGSRFIQQKEAELAAMVKADRITLHNANVDMLQALEKLDLRKVKDVITANKVANELGYGITISEEASQNGEDSVDNIPAQPRITERRQMLTVESVRAGWRMVEGKWVKTGNEFLKPDQGPPMFDEVVVETQPASEERPSLSKEEWLRGLRRHAADMAMDDDALLEGKSLLLGSNALLPVQSILFSGEPVNLKNDKRLKLQEDLAAFKLAVMTEEQQERIGRANLTEEEQASLAKLNTAKEIEMYASGESRSDSLQALLKARRLRAEAAINKPFAEEEMAKFNGYMQALDQYNETNRRVVDLVLGSESLDSTNFGLRFQSLVYAKFDARDAEEMEAYVKAKMDGRPLFFDPEQGLDDITPTSDKESAYGVNYYPAAFQVANRDGADRLRYHVDRPGVPFIPEMVPSADGMSMVEKPYDKSKVFTLERNSTAKDVLLNRHVASNMAAVGTNYQMQWQKLLTEIGVNEELAQRYEGSFGFNTPPIENDEFNATTYEGLDSILPNIPYGKYFIDFLNGHTRRATTSRQAFFTSAGIPEMIKHEGGETDRANQATVSTTAEYGDETFANYFQKLRNWATKLQESTDPKKILGDISGMQTLAGRLSSRIHDRATEALQLINEQEARFLKLHFDVVSSGLSGKEIAAEVKAIFSSPSHSVLDASVRSLRNEARWARGAVRRFVRSRPNVSREVTQTSRDAGMVAYSDFFESARKGHIDYPTMQMVLWNINYFSKSKTSAVSATFGMDLYEKFRRISFSKEDGELVVGGQNWVWSDVPVFERNAKGEVVFEEMFEKRGVGKNGEEFTELVSASHPDYQAGMPVATTYRTESVNGVAVRRSVPARQPKVRRDANGEVLTVRKQIHVDMDPSEAIAYAIADKDNSGHFPLASQMGTQGSTVQETREGRATEDSSRSRSQRAQVTTDLQRQLQNKRLTEAALLVGLNLDGGLLPVGESAADAPRQFLRDLVALENDPSGYDAFIKKAIRGLFGATKDTELAPLVKMYHDYASSRGVEEIQQEENYEAEEAIPKEVLPIKPVQGSFDMFGDAIHEEAMAKWEKETARITAQNAPGAPTTRTVTKTRTVTRMGVVPSSTRKSVSTEINPFELMESLIEFKAKSEMELIDQARVVEANGNGNDANKELLLAVRTAVGYALSTTSDKETAQGSVFAKDSEEIKNSFAATASKMAELGMGDLFAPRKGNGFASSEEARKIALMMQAESRGDKAINLHRGNVFAQYNETGFVSANRAVNLLTQNIPGVLVYRASKSEIDKNQAYFGLRFLPGVDGNPPVLYAAEGSNSADNEAMVVQALVWWGTQSESAALVAPVLQEAAERIRVALSPTARIESFMRAHRGNEKAISKMLAQRSRSLLEQNPEALAAMDEAAKEAEVKILSGLLRDHFASMETIHALASESERDRAVDVGRVDLSGLNGEQTLKTDVWLIAQAMTNPNMKKLLDRFLFGDNLLKSSDLSNATLNEILLANKQMGEDAVEEQDPYAFDNALEVRSAPATDEDAELAEEQAADDVEKSWMETELEKFMASRVDTTERQEVELDIEPSTEDKELLRSVEPTVASILQYLRNKNHDIAEYGMMDKRMEAVLEEFHRGRGGFEDPSWNGESLPASDAMMINLFVDLIGLAKEHPAMRFNATKQMEGLASSRPTPGKQLLGESTSPQARPVVRQNTPKGLRRTQESSLPGREGVPVVTAWHNMMDGRINGRTASTLHHESNRFKSFAGGLLNRVSGVELVLRKEAERSIDQGTQSWVEMGKGMDKFIAYPRAFADMALTPELFAEMKKAFPMLEGHEAEARRKLKAMQDRKEFLEKSIIFHQTTVNRIESEMAAVPDLFNAQTITLLDDVQREAVMQHVLAEADAIYRSNLPANLASNRSAYQKLLNQTIGSISTFGKEAAAKTLIQELNKAFDFLENGPDIRPIRQKNTRALLNEMQLPNSLKAEIAERGKVLGAAEMNKLRLARQNVELASKELAGLVRVDRNPSKGGFFQRLAYGSVTPWAAGRHTFVSGEKGPTGRAESVNATIVLYPAGTTPNFENKMGIEAGIAQLTAKWNATPAAEKDHEFYIMKEALTKSLGQYARHADELYRAVKGDQAYFNDYNPAAIIRQVSDTLTLQEKIAEARLAEFKTNSAGSKRSMSQLSPDALALLAEPGVHSIYSTSNVKAAMDVRDELAQRQTEAERAKPLLDKLVALQNEKTRLVKLSVNPKFRSGLRGNLEVINNQIKATEAKLADEKVFTHPIAGNLRKIKSLQADLARLNAARRVSKYKVPANFEARKDIIGHLINNGEWIMLGQINAEQDLKNRFASDNELTPAEKAAKRKGKRITMRDVVLNSLPDTEEPSPVPQSKNRMGFTRQWKDESWTHSFGGARFTPAGTTREQVAKEYATRHAGLLIDRANARPGDKAAGFKLAADKKVDAEHVDMKNALSQLSHMVEALVLGYDKLSPSTEPDQRGLKEDVKKFIESLGDDSINQSDNTAQQVRLFELFERMSARIEGEAALQQLLTGLSTNLSTAELTAMKLLHHHDARVRVRYRKNYLAQLEAMRLHGILQNGFDMNSGRNGWISQLEAEKKVMAKKHLALGNDSLMQSIPYMIASLQGLLNVRTNSVAANFSMWSNDLKKGVKDLSLYKDAQQANRRKVTDGVVKQAMGGVKGFFTDEHVNVMRDENMVKELYALIEDIVDSPYVTKGDKEAYAVEQINLAIERLYAKSEEGGAKDAAKEYADYIGAKFKGMTDAAEIMMMAMGHDQKDQEDINPSEAFLAGRLHGQARLISTVPLRYAYATDPAAERLSLEVTPYKSDPLHEVGFQEMSLLGGPGRTEKRDKNKKTLVFRPVSLNGISAIEGMLDDTLYRLNVTPVYSSLRNIVGSVQQAGPNQAEIVNSLILGEDEQNADKRLQRVALAGIASEFDNEIANDMQHGVTDTAFAESIQFLSSMYIFKALASFQQWWNQSAPSLLGYGAKKLLSGKWNEAGMMFEAMGQIATSKSFDKNEPGDYNHDAKEFMLRVAPWSSFRGADGMDQVKTNLRNQTRHGVGNVRKYSGKAAKVTQEWQEKALDLTIAKPERLLSRAIFLTELMAELQWMKSRGLIDGEVPNSITEMIKAENKGRFDIPQEAVEAAQTKLNDHMGVSDKAKKSFFFQNKTSSPTWNALMRSIVRFSNHQASTASNMSAMAPTLWQAERHALTTLNENGEYVPTVNEAGEYIGGQMTDGGKRAHQNAVENLVGTMVQNSMFHALKIRNLLPILLSVGYMLGGDDEDEAMAKAQEQADKLFNSEGEDNAVVGALKAMTIGKPGQFFQDWKDPDAAAASAYAGLGSSMLSEVLPVVPVAGAVLGLFPVASAFKNGITNNVVQEATAKLTGLESAENKWDKDAVNVWEMESSGIKTAMQLTAPTGVLYDLASGLNLAYDANETGEVSAFDISLYLAQEILFSTREGRQTSKKVLQEAVWANEP